MKLKAPAEDQEGRGFGELREGKNYRLMESEGSFRIPEISQVTLDTTDTTDFCPRQLSSRSYCYTV